ncbi:extracellular solute-binding protein [Paenibacillus sp. CF384]|uniref:extracellular solute-binding protein n=1 Tax=Paenibacillus sp. CF384 TaxID=1884382 RepID=UPI0008987765|nr:extracellular solute-binding protein [Paenibacillus sp. CF384]SDX62228.1 putative aldouronate transport system substrate-binding protein [Paenibacillus sp. CF384]
MRKGILSTMAVLLVTASLAACGNNNDGGNNGAASNNKAENSKETANTSNTQTNNAAANTATDEVIDPFAKFAEPTEVSIGRAIDPNYKFDGTDTAEDNVYTRWLKDKFNIVTKHAWEAAQGPDYQQKVSLAISSNDLPDAMVVNETQLRQMVKAGQLADLNEVYDKYASPELKAVYDSNPGLLDGVTFDGKLYALPETTLPSAPLTWIRKDWLDKLGLQPPKSLQDLETIAKAFIDNKMGGDKTVGIVGTQQGGTLYSTFLNSTDHWYNFSSLFFANDAYPGIWVKDKDGNAVYGSTTPETKQALAMMKDWYAKGILDKELGVRKSTAEVVAAGQTGIFFGPWWSAYNNIPDNIKNDPKANWRPYAAPLDAAGKFNSNQATGSSYIVISKNAKHPEAIVKMTSIHKWGKDEEFNKLTAGKQMTSQEVPLFLILGAGDQLEYAVNSLRKHLKGEMKLEDFDQVNYGWAYEMAKHVDAIKKEPFDSYDIGTFDQAADPGFFTHIYAHLNGGSTFVDADINWVRSIATAQTKTMESRWTNLKKMEDETFLKIIMGSEELDAFDTFVTKWKDQGGDKITEEVNELK